MIKYDKITPDGTRDLLFADCEAQNEVTASLRELFQDAGYREVATPGLEFYDVFSAKQDYYPQESMYKLSDNRGRLLAMRPDSTIPIARLTATKLQGHKLPIKLYYSQKVYRPQPELKGRSGEIMQAGIEFIGGAGFDADIETLELALESLSKTCTSPYRLELGHVGIYNLLIDDLGVDKDEREEIRRNISTKNYAALNDILEKFNDNKSAVILRQLPSLFGNGEALAEAKELSRGYSEELTSMLMYLEKIYKKLGEIESSDRIMIDFGLVNQADYYSSLVFNGYMKSTGEPVLSGGRYDDLYQDFGMDFPATGFALNVDRLAVAKLELMSGCENDFNVAEDSERDTKLRVALTKGRLEKGFKEKLIAAGYDTSLLDDKGRKLLLGIPGTNIEIVLAKAADVITYVEHGACDMGIVGKDTIAELGGTYYEILDLGIGKCKFALAAPKGKDFYKALGSRNIATKYPNVAGAYFESKGMDVRVIKIEGSVELAPILSLADGIVDLVETGTTLKENGLEVIENIRDISARLIVNVTSMKLKKDEIHNFVHRLSKSNKSNKCDKKGE